MVNKYINKLLNSASSRPNQTQPYCEFTTFCCTNDYVDFAQHH